MPPIVTESTWRARWPSFGATFWFSLARAAPTAARSVSGVPAVPATLKVALEQNARKSLSMPDTRPEMAGWM
jgi:hypothetical protein